MQGDGPTLARAGRTVTIMFGDVAGSTERCTRLSEAAAARLRERHLTLIWGERVTDMDGAPSAFAAGVENRPRAGRRTVSGCAF